MRNVYLVINKIKENKHKGTISVIVTKTFISYGRLFA